MTSLTPETFDSQVLAASGPVFVLFGQSDPETGRIAKLLAAAEVEWRFCDLDSSAGAQAAMRAGVRQSPVVWLYRGGLVVAVQEPASIHSVEVFHGA